MKIGDSKPVSPVARSVARYAQAADSSAAGAPRPVSDTASILGIPDAELTEKVRAAIMRLMEEVESLRRELDQSRQRITYLEQLADQDSLAPIANRRAFDNRLAAELAAFKPGDDELCLALADIDHFKKVNDEHGHAVGDEVIRLVSESMKSVIATRLS